MSGDIMEEKKVIGICGRAHNGKTMLSDHLINVYGYERFSVAHALKRMCANVLGFPSIEAMNEMKTVEKDYVLKDADLMFLSKESDVPYDFIKEQMMRINNTFKSVRHALQFIGTDMFRKYDNDWHVKHLLKEIKMSDADKIVIDDVRFKNELKLMESINATMIFIVRPVIDKVSHHPSEEDLDWCNFNNVIINNKTPEFAIEQLEDILHKRDNKTFGNTKADYNYLHLYGKDVITEDNYHIKIMEGPTLVGEFDIESNPLIVEDLKRKLRYETKKENES